ncbi:hypothetical protein HZA38_05525 [Candidatus Peregrinibacteria bacterium]|nr:hypothetical protein [Candidatus Peregrinibacteria bacterium]
METHRISAVKKRDGSMKPFDQEKIKLAIYKAAQVVAMRDGIETNEIETNKMTQTVLDYLKEQYANRVPTVEEINDMVEVALIKSGHARTAKEFILYRFQRQQIREGVLIETKKILSKEFLSEYQEKQPKWGFNGMGYITYKRTYARIVEGQGRTEEWWETVERCVEWVYHVHKKNDVELGKKYYEDLFDAVFNLKANFAGRMLWQAGTQTVEKLGGASLNNCWCLIMDNSESILNTFDYLMLGGGVGFNIQKKYVEKLPMVKGGVAVVRNDVNDADFITPDSREGWIALMRRVLNAFFETGESFTYSLACIRGYGEPIKGFGGKASGPEPLANGILKICDVFHRREGKKLRPIDVLDILNVIGEIVVAGNVRRSAEIALGDPDDIEYLEAKMWAKGVPNHRSASNNSLICSNFSELPDEFWKGYEINPETGVAYSEPYGLFNLQLAREKGRLVDDHRKDPLVVGTNPCAEITLAPTEGNGGAEPCNLCEIYLNNIKDADEFEHVAKLMYPVVKIITRLPYHQKATDEIVKKNSRLGIGLTGIVMRPDLATQETLMKVYRSLEKLDAEFSKKYNMPESIKLTTVKPSGTLSILAGATPGVHPAYSKYYTRRIRMSSDDPLVQLCREAGLHVEHVKQFDGSEDHRTSVVSFPIQVEDGVIVAAEMTAIKQLDLVKHLQSYWADNSVSVTVYYKIEELPEIKKWMKANYNTGLKTVSFLLHQKHGFEQMPYEEISAEQFEKEIKKFKGFPFQKDMKELRTRTFAESVECEGGHCPVR